MARRDVDLVIKARDEAASVVNTITNAINQFTDAQKDLEARSEKTEGSLAGLGSALGNLDKQLRGLSVGQTLTAELDKANGALVRLEDRFAQTSAESAEYSTQLRRSEAATARYTQKLEGAVSAQERQRAAISRSKADQKGLTAAYNAAAAAQAKLEARQQKLPGLIDRASAAASKAAIRFDDLGNQIAGTVNPSKSLQQQMAASERSASSTALKLTKLREEYSQIGGNIRAAGSATAIFSAQANKASAAVSRQERAYAKIGENLSTLKVKTSAAASQQGVLAKASAKSNAALAQQGDQVKKAQLNYEKLVSSTGEAGAALEKLANSGLDVLNRQFAQQRRAVLETKREYLEAKGAATQLGAAMSKTSKPTAQMTTNFEQAKVSSSRLKAELLDQRTVYAQLGVVLQGTSGDIESVRASQQRFGQVQEQLAGRLERSASAADRQQREIAQLNGTTNTAAGSSARLAREQAKLATSNGRAASSTERLGSAYRQFYGDTRRSLSLLQRIRGEVLSLVAAYAGLYAGVEVLKGTVDATQQLEAAQSRLGVAFNGDTTRVTTELDFLRRTANRLGVDMGTLATEYSKFNIATKNTSLEGAAARKIFVQVAEAARVNRSSTEELSGVFVALTQIVSKGAVQMEELRQQLGDRLPGALKIMADGLGVSTQELIKMLEQGKVTEAALIPFGDELAKRFGPGLGQALASTNVAIGRLGAAAFQSLVKFGQAGFIESFGDFVNTLTSVLQSADFEAFAARASSALAGVVDFLGFLAKNFQLVVAAGAGFIGLRLTPVLVALASGFKTTALSAGSTTVAFTALQARAATMGVTITRAGFAVRTLTRFMQGLLSTTGIGLVVTGIAAAVALWSTEADKATESLVEHRNLVDQVKDAYDKAGGAIEGWRENLEDVTATKARKNLKDIKEAAEAAGLALLNAFQNDGETGFAQFTGIGSLFTGASQGFNRDIEKVIRQFREGSVSAEALQKEVDAISEKFNDGSAANERYANALDEAVKQVVLMAEKEREAQAIVDAKTGSVVEATEAAKALGIANDGAAAGILRVAEASEQLEAAIDAITKLGPEMSEFAKDVEAVEIAFQQALEAALQLPDAAAAAARAQANAAREMALANVAENNLNTGLSGGLVDRIIGVESGGNPNAKNPNSSATGLGQFIESTWLRLFKENFPNRAAELTNAAILALRTNGTESRNLTKLYIQENAKILASKGIEITDAKLYLAHFLGAGGASSLLKSAPGTKANDVLGKGQIDSNKSILDGKTREEVLAWAQRKVGISKTELSVIESTQQAEQERLEKARKFHEEQTAGIEQKKFELSLQDQGLLKSEKAKAIREAELAAKAAGTTLSAQERAQIERTTEALFRKQAIEEQSEKIKERAAKAEERVGLLTEKRAALQEQMALATSSGDFEKTEELKEKIAEVNTELQAAIVSAQEMWAAVGGESADTAITKLETARLKTDMFGQGADNVYLQWNRVAGLFVNGLSSAFDSFSQSVAEGQSVGEAARNAFLQFASDFLRQIAQMIIQQAIFNALKSAFGGTGFGSLIGLPAGHTGGVVGSSKIGSGNQNRSVNPAVFAGAMRYHVGGIAGLRPGELPAILKQGEEVLTKDDPRHALNGAAKTASSGKGMQAKIVNAIDSEGFLEAALATSRGEELFLNFVRANGSKVKAAIG